MPIFRLPGLLLPPIFLLRIAMVCIVFSLAVLAWLRFAPVTVAEGWRYNVRQENLPRVTALAHMSDGRLLATLSAKQKVGQVGAGQLIQLDVAANKYTVLADNLYKPDGLMPYKNGIVVTQEFPDQPVLWWHDGRIDPLFMLVNPESIIATKNNQWLVVEDALHGRLLEIDPPNYHQTVLYEGFEAGEGICIGREQRVFVVDNKSSELWEFVNGGMKKIIGDLNGPGFLRCTESGIWITEDVTNNGHLLFYDYQQLHVIARHLHSPQSVLEDGDSILVAEQGRSRLLEFSRK